MDESYVSITPLLKQLCGPSMDAPGTDMSGDIAAALSLIFQNKISVAQCASLLTVLQYSGEDRKPLVLVKCAACMREAAMQVDRQELRRSVQQHGRKEGQYDGGLCDMVGTGGDGHSTFNVSTTASILVSSLLLISKHGNRASSSTSGSSDLLQAIKPKGPIIEAVTSTTLASIYQKSNYAFLFAPQFHPGMKHAAAIRKQLGFRTIFNILGPLANPVEGDIEARVVGVAKQSLGVIFAEALMLTGAKKAMVVCGAENLDEISCAGKTTCWRLHELPAPPQQMRQANGILHGSKKPSQIGLEVFEVEPEDFGLPRHPLSDCAGGKSPDENAEILMRLLRNELPHNDPVLHFVLINAAALFAIAGVCEANTSSMGEKDDGKVIEERGPGKLRWKEGVRRARWAIESGEALFSLEKYIEATHSVS